MLTLPPWLRRIQQAWWFQIFVQPMIVAALPVLYACSGDNFSNISFACVKLAAGAAGVALYFTLQHSFGSASFMSNGEINQAVKVAADAAKAGQTVRVMTTEKEIVQWPVVNEPNK